MSATCIMHFSKHLIQAYGIRRSMRGWNNFSSYLVLYRTDQAACIAQGCKQLYSKVATVVFPLVPVTPTSLIFRETFP